jgi:catechol 2,3-dioxygenase-like lactoylglutathione lyase family enzyme
MKTHIRIARPVSNLARAREQYCRGLDLRVIGSFENHEGFDGVMLGRDGQGWHFEFTICRNHPLHPAPTLEDLVVFYEPDAVAWRGACERALQAGFVEVASFNPYWDQRGHTFADFDGYRTVIQNAAWRNIEEDTI